LRVIWAIGDERRSGRTSIIEFSITIGVRVSTYTIKDISSKMGVETERNEVRVSSSGSFLGNFEFGGLISTSGNDVTGVLFKKRVANSGRTEEVGWVGNSDIEIH